jgi:hypothetical protein
LTPSPGADTFQIHSPVRATLRAPRPIMQIGFRALTGLVALACSAYLLGCADDYGESCDMPNTALFNAACNSSDGNQGTCVFRNSPDCSTRICARYQGSTDFCTQECDTADASSCPGDSVCYAPANRVADAICIPQSILDEVTETP